jgi:hypothetical protein
LLDAGIDESSILRELSNFECKREPEIERFLHERAIPFERAHKSRTYLILENSEWEEGNVILAYVSVALSNLNIKVEVSKSMRKRLNGIFQNDEVPCYLIGQIGKNDRHPNRVDGSELIDFAFCILRIGYRAVGGRFVRVDSKMNDKLIRFYEENGFKPVQYDEKSGLLQFVRFFDQH